MSPSPLREGSGERAVSPFVEKNSIFSLKIAILGAFRATIFTVQRTVLYADDAD